MGTTAQDATCLEESWVQREFAGQLPELREAVPAAPERAVLAWPAILASVSAALGLWLALGVYCRSRAGLAGALLLAASAAGLGSAYDSIRLKVHDHGFNPERSLYLLVPFALGFGLAFALRRFRVLRSAKPGAWLPTGTAASLIAIFLLLFPSANFYGASRAIVYAALAMVVVLLIDVWRHELSSPRARPWMLFSSVLAVLTLCSFCRVARAENANDAAVYVLGASVYGQAAWLPFVLAKILLFALLSRSRADERPFDAAAAAAFFTAALLVQLGDAHLNRWLYAALAVSLCIGYAWARRHAPMAHLAGCLLLLNHCYPADPVRLAPIELLLGSTAVTLSAWQRTAMRADSLIAASGLTLLTAAYLLLWPTLGFRFSGIDFRFMFQWVPPSRYEELWWLIGLGTVFKLALPYLVLCSLAHQVRIPRQAGGLAFVLLSAKVMTLSLMVTAYAAKHGGKSNLAMDMLAELALVTAALVCSIPLVLRAKRAHPNGTNANLPVMAVPAQS
jgi:hypothetical protein